MLKHILLNFVESSMYLIQKQCIRYIYKENTGLEQHNLFNTFVVWCVCFNLHWFCFHESITIHLKEKESNITTE